MLYGDLLSEGGRYRLAMSLMDLKSGELLWNASRSAARWCRLVMSLMDLKGGELLWNASRSAARCPL